MHFAKLNLMKKWCKKDSGAEKILGKIWVNLNLKSLVLLAFMILQWVNLHHSGHCDIGDSEKVDNMAMKTFFGEIPIILSCCVS